MKKSDRNLSGEVLQQISWAPLWLKAVGLKAEAEEHLLISGICATTLAARMSSFVSHALLLQVKKLNFGFKWIKNGEDIKDTDRWRICCFWPATEREEEEKQFWGMERGRNVHIWFEFYPKNKTQSGSSDTPSQLNYCEECACACRFRCRTRGDNDACWQQEVRCKSFVATALMSPRITSNQSVMKEKRVFFECVTRLHLLRSCSRYTAASRQLHELVQAVSPESALRLQLLELILPGWIEQDEQQLHGHTLAAAAFVCFTCVRM